MQLYRIIGYRIDTDEAVVDEEWGETAEESARAAAGRRMRRPDGLIDEAYVFVCVLDEEGLVQQRADEFPQIGPFDPDFVVGDASLPAFLVIATRLADEEPVIGEVRAHEAVQAVDTAQRYHDQLMGRFHDCHFVAALEGRAIVLRCENWTRRTGWGTPYAREVVR